ncbi:MAG: AAA family ATPase [Gaiellaceae bacterium]
MAVAQSPGLVGREEELDRIRDFLDADGEAGTKLLLEGEPGIGKTTLWHAGLGEAARRGFRVLAARPVAAERDLSFTTLGDLFADARELIDGLPAPQRRALRIALVLESATGEPLEQRTIAVAVTELLRRIGRESALVIAVDDANWLDAPSAAILEFALRRLDQKPARMLATSRANEQPRISFAENERMTVGPIPLNALDALIRHRLDTRFLRPALRQLEVASGGNPFYALELAADLVRSGRTLEPGERLPIPSHLRAAANRRLATLTAPAREAVLAAAALAQPTVRVVETAIGGGEAAIAEASSAGVLERNGDVLRFTHPLFASTVYDDTPLRDRKAMHRRLGAVVTDPEERARHLADGADGPDATVAAFVEAAAARVAARGAPDAAARLAKLAVELTPPHRRNVLHKRRLDSARYVFAAGDPKQARAMLERHLELARPGRERAEVQFQLGRVRRDTEGFESPRACYENALAQLDENDEVELQAMILVELAGIPSVGSETSTRAVALAEWLAKPDLTARALGVHGMNLTLEGRPPPAQFWQRALELETDELRFDGPTSLYAYSAFITGDLKTASEQGERLFASMRRRDDPLLARALLDMVENARVSGDWEAATRYADEAHLRAVQTGQEAVEPQCLLYKARVALPRGDLDLARRCTEEALSLFQSLPAEDSERHVYQATAYSVLGQIAEMTNAHDEAHRWFTGAIEEAECVGKPMQQMLAELIAGDAECLLALGQLDGAALQVERLRELQGRLGFATLEALLARAQGLLVATAGDSAHAVEQLARAVQLFEELPEPHPFQVARAQLALGVVQRRARQKLPARRTLEGALETFEQLGAQLWAERARAELDRIGGRPSHPGALTATEACVAKLVAAGRSNAEVATELSVSPKTVEWNLSKIYKKLHVRSRAELAAKLARRPASAQS